MDPLSDLLRVVRLDGAFFYAVEAAEPWSAEAVAARELSPRIMPGAEHLISYHVLTEGRCYGGLIGEEQVELGPGDVIVFPHGDSHLMSSGRGVRVGQDVSSSAPARYPFTLHHGGQGPPGASLVCGFLGCDRRPFNPLLASLPRRMHMRGMSNAWLGSFVRQVTEESRLGRAGADCVLTRLAELMFIEVLRRYLDDLPPGQTGWLAGLRDEVVGRALTLLHARPSHPWTLAESGSGSGLFPVQPRQAVRGARGPAADAVSGPMADAGRGQPPGPEWRQGRRGRRGRGLRLRGRVQPGLQEGDRARPGAWREVRRTARS